MALTPNIANVAQSQDASEHARAKAETARMASEGRSFREIATTSGGTFVKHSRTHAKPHALDTRVASSGAIVAVRIVENATALTPDLQGLRTRYRVAGEVRAGFPMLDPPPKQSSFSRVRACSRTR